MQENLAISIENLCKKYRIGALEKKYTIRDYLEAFLKHPFGIGIKKNNQTDFWALKNVTFDIKKGEVVGIIGRNGSGKSTLLKILTKIVQPTNGLIKMRGKVASLLEVGTGFNQELTGRENTYLNGSILGMKKKEIERKMSNIIEFAGIENFMDTPVKRYSSGMYVRLAFAVAAHLDADILLVDEVLAVGDIGFQNRCLGKMDELAHSGRTVLFVSHDMSKIRQLCNRGIYLHKGEILKIGLISRVCDAYESDLVDHTIKATTSVIRDKSQQSNFYIKKVELRDNHNLPKADYNAKDEVNIHVWFNSNAPANNYTVEIQVINSLGKVISFATANPIANTFFQKNNQHVICTFPKLPLTSGRYHLSFSVRIWGQERWDDWEDAISFIVNKSDWYNTGYNNPSPFNGDFVMDQSWTVGEP